MSATAELARFVTATGFDDLPAAVVHAAKRNVINLLGTAIYSARDPSLQILLGLYAEEGGRERARVWGAGTRTTLQNAAFANGYLGHLEDYDDTHFPTVLHPSAPTVPAAFALAEAEASAGRDFLAAVALGIEACCRVANAVHPWHYDAGWHITGTMGVFGGAVAAAKLAGLDDHGVTMALGTAGTQAAGVRESFGTMAKPLHAGRAAQTGLQAALLARRGFTATARIFEGRRGVFAVMSSESDASRLTAGLGSTWELFNNGLKPYACGVVNHPLIDACVAFRAEGVDLAAIEAIEADVHPLVLELVNLPEPKVGLEGKFSVQHCVAVGLVDGAAYPAQFTDTRVADPAVAALRSKVALTESETLGEDEAVVRLRLKDGRRLEKHVEHATGAPENPLSDEALAAKFVELTAPTLGGERSQRLLDQLWRLDALASLAELDV